jgi:hypothetical protein
MVRSQLENNEMRKTYIAGALATSSRSTDLGGSNDIAINVGTFLIGNDREFDIPKTWADVAVTWQI